ncbi:hypothetical protein GWK48_09940 [Metallosphaera tengchongensis]|uniref:Glycosyltransferase family 2 protein n=1 Tax=Metallosphaera tengchongensis TaxID=1532350 RepID=A0A6N0P132_9CREN|nr:hypothetical protein GWK48_09940 [Metallosphaera tengchongensis]
MEELFSSQDPVQVERLYSLGRERILDWMKGRPRADLRIVEVEGDQEVVVVIPTADSKGRRSREASRIFHPLHVVLVESSGNFFNYASSVNAGIRRAMDLSPRWVVVSNDDVHKVDGVKTLVDELSVATRGLVMASPSSYHSYRVSLVKMSPSFLRGMNVFGKVMRLPPAEVYSYLTLKYGAQLGVKTLVVIDSMLGPMKRVAGEVKDSFINAGSFMVLNRRILHERVLDETFINGYEDVLLSMKMRGDSEFIKFRIAEERGGSLGFGELRFLKSYVNEVYLNYLLWGSRT